MRRGLRKVVCMFAIALGLGLTGTAASVIADEPIVDLNSPEVIKASLEQQIGKRVKIKLESGQDLDGKVARVGSHGVQLTELTGMEFFDATVKLDDIIAVIVKVRGKS